MSLTQTILNNEATAGPGEFFCHICGGCRTDRICSSDEVGEQIEFLRRFHRRRLQHPTEAALKDRVTFTHDYLSDVVACRNCGVICRLPRPTARAITEAYSEDRYGAEHLNSEFDLQYQWAQAKVRSLETRLQNSPSRRPFVVEVGSFVGGFLFAGQERGWKMMGVDPGQEVTTFCQDRGLDVWRGTLMEAPIKAGTVDAVVIWNTFDQLPNPDSTLAAARRILRSHGTVVVRVPNGSFFRQLTVWHKQFSEPVKGWVTAALAWNNLLGFPYLYGYTLSAMDQVLGRHGFARLAVCPDTLMTLANQDAKTWARWEEKLVKWSCLAAAHVDQAWNEDGNRFAPWLDIYYRVGPTLPDTRLTVARESHADSTCVAAHSDLTRSGPPLWVPYCRVV